MQMTLERVVRQAGDRIDWERQAEAISQLRNLLEMKNRPVEPEWYESVLPADLRSVTFEEGEEQELVYALEQLIITAQSERERRSLSSPLVGASPRYVIEPVLRLLMRCENEGWAREDAWSILIALRNALDVFAQNAGRDFRSQAPVVAAAIRDNDPRAVLDKLAEVPDDRVDRLAKHVRAGVQVVFEPPAPRWLACLASLRYRIARQ